MSLHWRPSRSFSTWWGPSPIPLILWVFKAKPGILGQNFFSVKIIKIQILTKKWFSKLLALPHDFRGPCCVEEHLLHAQMDCQGVEIQEDGARKTQTGPLHCQRKLQIRACGSRSVRSKMQIFDFLNVSGCEYQFDASPIEPNRWHVATYKRNSCIPPKKLSEAGVHFFILK